MDRVKALWEALNARGIHNMKELEEETRKMPPLDLSLMTGELITEKMKGKEAV